MENEEMIIDCLGKWRAYGSTLGEMEDENIKPVTPEQFALVYWFIRDEETFTNLAKKIRNGWTIA